MILKNKWIWRGQMKSEIVIPQTYNYIGVFLTFACQLRCKYCINNEFHSRPSYSILNQEQLVEGLNRVRTRADLPITLQGGEPTLHPQFYGIVNGIRNDTPLDLLTNCQFNVNEFCDRISPERFKRDAPYASIRVSYHPQTMELHDTVQRVVKLKEKGYSVGVWIVDYPGDRLIPYYQKCFVMNGIDCRLKEYLDGREHGTYKYLDIQGRKNVLCKPSELLIAPDGSIHRCHGDLYGNKKSLGNILDTDVKCVEDFIPCKKVACSACDHKIKYDRFQKEGHCAVEIKHEV